MNQRGWPFISTVPLYIFLCKIPFKSTFRSQHFYCSVGASLQFCKTEAEWVDFFSFFCLALGLFYNDPHRFHSLPSHQVNSMIYHCRNSTERVVKNPKSSSNSATNHLCARAGQLHVRAIHAVKYGTLQINPTTVLRFCCHHLVILNHFLRKGLKFSFCTGSHKLCGRSHLCELWVTSPISFLM